MEERKNKFKQLDTRQRTLLALLILFFIATDIAFVFSGVAAIVCLIITIGIGVLFYFSVKN